MFISTVKPRIIPMSWNRAHFKREFSIDRIGIFRRFLWKSVDKIPNIGWVCNKIFWTENSVAQQYQNSFFEKTQIWSKISDMDWAQNINMDYAQNLKKDPVKAKKRP